MCMKAQCMDLSVQESSKPGPEDQISLQSNMNSELTNVIKIILQKQTRYNKHFIQFDRTGNFKPLCYNCSPE